jgi:hypothetical protein
MGVLDIAIDDHVEFLVVDCFYKNLKCSKLFNVVFWIIYIAFIIMVFIDRRKEKQRNVYALYLYDSPFFQPTKNGNRSSIFKRGPVHNSKLTTYVCRYIHTI